MAAINKTVKAVLLVSACLIITGGAAVAGYTVANRIASGITGNAEAAVFEKSDENESAVSEEYNDLAGSAETEAESQNTGYDSVVVLPAVGNSLKYSEILVSQNENTGEICDIVVQLLDCVGMRLTFIYLDTDCDYTMSASLYRELANENVLLPQTVRLSKLDEYYKGSSKEKVFLALKRILSEMLNCNIDFYTVLRQPEFSSIFSIGSKNAVGNIKLNVNRKLIFAGSAGQSCREFIEEKLENALTDMDISARISYVPIYDVINEENIVFESIAMNVKNESCEADIGSISDILLEYKAEE